MTSSQIPKCFTGFIEHDEFRKCREHLLTLLDTGSPKPIIVVTGPTGVGKTTLIAQLRESLTALTEPIRQNNPEILPFGGCSVKAPGQTAFSWKDTYIELLRSLRHPFPDARPISTKANDSESTQNLLTAAKAHRTPNDLLFRKLQKTILNRKPRAVLFDEAHHLLRVGSSQSLVNQLEHIKYIADETHTPHVLFGTYELTRLLDLSSALIRRREIIHFERYRYDSDDPQGSLKPFAQAVSGFSAGLSAFTDFDLLEQVPYLYQGSVGCVGVLCQWLYQAYLNAKSGDGKITMDLLQRTALATRDKKALLDDILEGEKYFASRNDGEDDYLRQLGFVANDAQPPSPAVPKRKPRPGQRKPHNDPVGTGALEAARSSTS